MSDMFIITGIIGEPTLEALKWLKEGSIFKAIRSYGDFIIIDIETNKVYECNRNEFNEEIDRCFTFELCEKYVSDEDIILTSPVYIIRYILKKSKANALKGLKVNDRIQIKDYFANGNSDRDIIILNVETGEELSINAKVFYRIVDNFVLEEEKINE